MKKSKKNLKLFAVYVGGKAPKCNTELHDMVFTVGEKIEDTYDQIRDAWFGLRNKVHIDAWMHLDVVDGYKILLTEKKPKSSQHLYFVNLGAYLPEQFTEIHENFFIVAEDVPLAKKKAKSLASKGLLTVHKDFIRDVDDCISIDSVAGLWINLQVTKVSKKNTPVIGYHKLSTV